tara:strand:+ start:480 stop:629 length:150 start_codon:yes stop_codon:yes gene_type:complete
MLVRRQLDLNYEEFYLQAGYVHRLFHAVSPFYSLGGIIGSFNESSPRIW